ATQSLPPAVAAMERSACPGPRAAFRRTRPRTEPDPDVPPKDRSDGSSRPRATLRYHRKVRRAGILGSPSSRWHRAREAPIVAGDEIHEEGIRWPFVLRSGRRAPPGFI